MKLLNYRKNVFENLHSSSLSMTKQKNVKNIKKNQKKYINNQKSTIDKNVQLRFEECEKENVKLETSNSKSGVETLSR